MLYYNNFKEDYKILTSTKTGQLTAQELKALIEQSLDDDKALDINIIDLEGKSDVFDYMIVASGRSSTHTTAIAESLKERLNKRGLKDIHLEGIKQGDWVLVDMGDIVVHLFRPEVREFYSLEKMWSAPIREASKPKAPAIA